VNADLNLNGKAFFNEAENNSWPVEWSKVSGPGAVSFGAANNRITTARFTAPGTYVLRFTAIDQSRTDAEGMTHYVSDEISNSTPGRVVSCTCPPTVMLISSDT
ncbi:MAG: hypothetical protein AAFO94_07120, partial [Bacteroidota bacterium]